MIGWLLLAFFAGLTFGILLASLAAASHNAELHYDRSLQEDPRDRR